MAHTLLPLLAVEFLELELSRSVHIESDVQGLCPCYWFVILSEYWALIIGSALHCSAVGQQQLQEFPLTFVAVPAAHSCSHVRALLALI